MSVYRIRNKNQFDQLCLKRGINYIIPVNDGNGDLILSMECLNDIAFDGLKNGLLARLEEVTFVPMTDDLIPVLEANGDLIKVTQKANGNLEAEHKGNKKEITETP